MLIKAGRSIDGRRCLWVEGLHGCLPCWWSAPSCLVLEVNVDDDAVSSPASEVAVSEASDATPIPRCGSCHRALREEEVGWCPLGACGLTLCPRCRQSHPCSRAVWQGLLQSLIQPSGVPLRAPTARGCDPGDTSGWARLLEEAISTEYWCGGRTLAAVP